MGRAGFTYLDRIYPGETKTRAGFHWAGRIFRIISIFHFPEENGKN
jgi:hypothetical protein